MLRVPNLSGVDAGGNVSELCVGTECRKSTIVLHAYLLLSMIAVC